MGSHDTHENKWNTKKGQYSFALFVIVDVPHERLLNLYGHYFPHYIHACACTLTTFTFITTYSIVCSIVCESLTLFIFDGTYEFVKQKTKLNNYPSFMHKET